MDAERARTIMLGLPRVAETMQWGDNLVFWVGDKAIGGKMFALVSLDSPGLVASFAAGPEHAAELCEVEGFRPAPYFARAHWVAAERWDVLPLREWERELAAAHSLILAKLPTRTRSILQMPASEYKALVAERRQTPDSPKQKLSPSKKS